MTVASGSRLGPYEITAKLGEGGMGEVYRATDSRLKREVAIKVLPEAFTADRERLARFEREAQLLAQLQHPNIAAIYGLEESDGTRALVMELVDGEDLAQRIARGAIPVDEAIAIARQIAEALEAAHERGIVHRDLKPANVKLREDGTVKVLDFGLAKAMEAGAPASGPVTSPALLNSPTLTAAHATQLGMILGTAAYMAPEQARAKAADKRADVWALGVVLFEMLTGRRLFAGEEVSDVLAAVLRQEIDWSALPAATPPGVRRLLERCLERDPKQRLRDVGEARIALTTVESFEGEDSPKDRRGAPRASTAWLVAAIVGLLAGATGELLWNLRRHDAASKVGERPGRTFVLQSAGRGLDDSQAISPDGRWVAYTAGGSLWIRNLGELDAREVKESQGAQRPFWSPRSDAVAFATDSALFRVSIEGEKPVELCRLTGGIFTGGSWSAVEGIVFTVARANWNGDVLRVSETGGVPEVFTRADPARKERRLHDPYFLPDGKSLLYSVTTFDSNDGEIAVDRDGTRKLLGRGDGTSAPVYTPDGHLVFTGPSSSGTALWSVPFSLDSLSTLGTPAILAQGGDRASVAADGTLVYGVYRPAAQQLVWVDRTGQLVGAIGQPVADEITSPSISPNGTRVAVSDDHDVSVWDAERGISTVLTKLSGNGIGFWLPGGRELAYLESTSSSEIVARRGDGGGEARVLVPHLGHAAGLSSAPDGAFAVYYTVEAETARDLWAVALQGPSQPISILRTRANEAMPRVSPDGKLVAYQSDASGRWEVYVQPFPRGDERIQVSIGGGQHPMWNPRGGELFFDAGDDLLAVDVSTSPSLHGGTPHVLFSAATLGTKLSLPGIIERSYDVAADGRRFVVVKGRGTGTSDVVLAEGGMKPSGGR